MGQELGSLAHVGMRPRGRPDGEHRGMFLVHARMRLVATWPLNRPCPSKDIRTTVFQRARTG